MTLQFTHWDDIRQRPDTYLVWYTWIFDTFAAKHPGATAEFVLTTGNDLEKFVVAAAASPMADLAALSITYGRDLYDKGALLEVDAVNRQVPDLAPAKYHDAANDYRTAGGRHFSLPAWANSSGCYCATGSPARTSRPRGAPCGRPRPCRAP